MGDLTIMRGGGTRFCWRGWSWFFLRCLSWDFVVGKRVPGLVCGFEGGKCWWTRRWDLSVVAELGFIRWGGAVTPLQAR